VDYLVFCQQDTGAAEPRSPAGIRKVDKQYNKIVVSDSKNINPFMSGGCTTG